MNTEHFEEPLFKTQPLIDYSLEKFRNHCVPGKDLALDEGMIPTKLRIKHKVFMRSKPQGLVLKPTCCVIAPLGIC